MSRVSSSWSPSPNLNAPSVIQYSASDGLHSIRAPRDFSGGGLLESKSLTSGMYRLQCAVLLTHTSQKMDSRADNTTAGGSSVSEIVCVV